MDPKEMGIQPTEVGNPTIGRLTVPAEDIYTKSVRS